MPTTTWTATNGIPITRTNSAEDTLDSLTGHVPAEGTPARTHYQIGSTRRPVTLSTLELDAINSHVHAGKPVPEIAIKPLRHGLAITGPKRITYLTIPETEAIIQYLRENPDDNET